MFVHSPSGAGRGAPRGAGRGAANRERKEKKLPQSIDEMPVYSEGKAKDFSDRNIFAGLLGSDGDEGADD